MGPELQSVRAELSDLMRSILAEGRPITFRVRGTSMSPFIGDGDTVTVYPLRNPPRVGDVVLFLDRHGRAVVHRVVGTGGGTVVTRGDSVGEDDFPAPMTNILGKVRGVEGSMGTFHLWWPFRLIVARRYVFPLSLLWSGPVKAVARALFGLPRPLS